MGSRPTGTLPERRVGPGPQWLGRSHWDRSGALSQRGRRRALAAPGGRARTRHVSSSSVGSSGVGIDTLSVDNALVGDDKGASAQGSCMARAAMSWRTWPEPRRAARRAARRSSSERCRSSTARAARRACSPSCPLRERLARAPAVAQRRRRSERGKEPHALHTARSSRSARPIFLGFSLLRPRQPGHPGRRARSGRRRLPRRRHRRHLQHPVDPVAPVHGSTRRRVEPVPRAGVSERSAVLAPEHVPLSASPASGRSS